MNARQKILILDDEHDILEIYQEILARLPSQPEIHTADNGARAIALLESEPFNLLLVDLRMPVMDGFQVLAIVRRKFPALRVVVMTAAEDEQFRARAYAMGIDLYIEKPKTGKEIINFVGLHRVAARARGARRLPRGAEQDPGRHRAARVSHAEFSDSQDHDGNR
jgi:CheY-like chemotaxis protein